MLSQFKAVGHALFTQGLVSPYCGNLSIKLGEHLFITHRGSALGSIGEADLVETGIAKNDRATPLASSELAVHRSIYKNTSALAVVHAHPPYAVALSFIEKEIIPCDMEGRALLPKVLILGQGIAVKAGDLGEEIAETLKQYKVVLVWGHGSFAAGQLLEEAYYYTSVLEQSCRLLYLLKALGRILT
ncbi:MAG: aldolase [Dehalococcoidia bacterium]